MEQKIIEEFDKEFVAIPLKGYNSTPFIKKGANEVKEFILQKLSEYRQSLIASIEGEFYKNIIRKNIFGVLEIKSILDSKK